MHKELIIRAFGKAEKELEKRGIKKPALGTIAGELADYGSSTKKFQLGEKSFKNCYSDALNLECTDEDIRIIQWEVVQGLCEYLGFENYERFVESLHKEDGPHRVWGLLKKYGLIILGIVTIGLFAIYFFADRERWMTWRDTQFVEVAFDPGEFRKGNLRIYDEDLIAHFRKINPDCSTEFFDGDGHALIWYGKDKNGALEYFTELYKHPQTGKSLKEITEYMIQKYICESYKKP